VIRGVRFLNLLGVNLLPKLDYFTILSLQERHPHLDVLVSRLRLDEVDCPQSLTRDFGAEMSIEKKSTNGCR